MLTLLSVEVTRFVSIGSRFVTKEREGCCFCCEIEEEERGGGLVVGYYTFKVANRIFDGKYIVTGYFYRNIIMYHIANIVVNIIFIYFYFILFCHQFSR